MDYCMIKDREIKQMHSLIKELANKTSYVFSNNDYFSDTQELVQLFNMRIIRGILFDKGKYFFVCKANKKVVGYLFVSLPSSILKSTVATIEIINISTFNLVNVDKIFCYLPNYITKLKIVTSEQNFFEKSSFEKECTFEYFGRKKYVYSVIKEG